ncbi:histidine kinase dimerization/phospho-acceptor domain-containing protein [Phyllobacterium leguminum]|uniref:histidine kinase n=1 Tax=Phyllobacterium leguminum TaxID=314237 RepID=A0A318T6Z4_9HYPH|nr:histidine kinase dimerization/phospho-acceptor domain-containing protein [Phyllobacterium leguminum]PYE90361.1 PAS/PAC sensor signal transduction histidine kinase [Phyllobacterium leguminum]
MAGTYPFIDIAVLDGIRERFLRGDALLVVSPDLSTVIWANGPGAVMFGFDRIDDILNGDPDFPAHVKRQIMALDGSQARTTRTVSVRFASHLITLQILDIALPDGTPARVLAAAGPSADIESTIQGLGDEDTHVALLDEAGAILARSAHFAALGILATTLSDLTIEVRDEESRMVKRRVRAGMRSVPAGIARLADDPSRHLLFVIAEGQAEQPVAAVAETVSADAEIPSPEIVGGPFAEEKKEGAEAPASAPTNALRDALIREGLLRQDQGAEKEAPLAEETAVVETPDLPASEPLPTLHSEPAEEEQEEGEYEAQPEAGPEAGNEEQTVIAPVGETTEDHAQAAGFVQAPEAAPARFVWKVDADTVFNEISPEFAAAVGPQAADIIGRRFCDVARVFGFDEDGTIAALLEGRDTWSGRTVLWPIEGTSLRAPIDLAALPVYSRERTFQGFRGFGVVHIGETVADPEAIGLALVAGAAAPTETVEEPEPQDEPDAQEIAPPVSPPVSIVDLGEKLAQKQDVSASEPAKPDPFQGEAPALQLTPTTGRRVHDKIIRLEEHRAPRPESTGLTQTERNAFREIADRLRKGGILPARNEAPVQPQAADTPAPAAEQPSEASHLAQRDEVAEPPTGLPLEREEAETLAPPPSDPEIAEEQAATDIEEDDASIIARLPLPVLVHSGDTVHYANQALLDLTGHETTGALIDAGGLAALFAEREVGEDGRPGAMMLRRADGNERAVEAHLQAISWKGGRALMLSLMPQPDAPKPAETTPVDEIPLTTEERRALETRIGELTSILDTATDGVVIIGPDGLIRSMNHSAEALFGYEPGQIKGKSFSVLFAIESQRAALDYLDGLAENGVASVLNDGREVIGREAQGRFIPMFMTIGKLAASNSYCAVLRDITQWKRAEEELTNARREAERASSQKTDFLARISHEIRTPLNAIIGFSELMADEKFGPVGNERYRDYLRDINRSGNHVLALVNDLLDISKIEAGGLDMDFEAVSLNDAIAEAVAIMQPQANRERVIIRSSFPANLPEIVADVRSIKQIALNLLSNAVRFTAPGGQVIVSTSYEANGGVVIRVRDTGIGMSDAEIEQALKPFKQVNAQKHNPSDGHADWRQNGTGLGLPLTKAMVEANRAVFSIESTPGNGTMVEVSFPSTRVLAD